MACYTLTNPLLILIVLCAISMLNYIDRSIIPGAPSEIDSFIKSTLNIDASSESVYLGMLQSSFIVGYALSSPIFAHYVHHFQPFRLMVVALIIWVLAIAGSGFSYYLNSFYVLLIARAFSGIGEAGFQCIVPPWICDNAPEGKPSLWLGIFFMSIPVGSAIGYIYAAIMGSGLGWHWAFFFEVVAMIPLILLCLAVPTTVGMISGLNVTQDHHKLIDENMKEDSVGIQHNPSSHDVSPPTIWEEFCIVLRTPIFVLIVLGYAARIASIGGLQTFGPTIVIARQFFSTETFGSMVFGGVIAVGGLVGTPIGGYFADRMTGTQTGEDYNKEVLIEEMEIKQNVIALKIMSWTTLVSTGLLMAMALMDSVIYYMGLLMIGSIVLFTSTSSITMSIMLSVPKENRAFAVALSTMGIHAFGDVPSPIAIGALMKNLAPDCGILIKNGTTQLNPKCSNDTHGLKLVNLISIAWMGWAIVIWFMSWMMALRKKKKIDTNHQLEHLIAP